MVGPHERITNENLAETLELVKLEVERTPDVVAAIVHEAITEHARVPHSGVAALIADSLDGLKGQLVDLVDGPEEADWMARPIRKKEKGLLGQLDQVKVDVAAVKTQVDAIQVQTNGGRKPHLPKPAWIGGAALVIFEVIQLIRQGS